MAHNLEEDIGRLLTHYSLTIAVAESCTGGLIGNLITNVCGSSTYFIGGIVAYDNRVKSEFLKVSAATLKKYGAVSKETAKKMAEGVRKLLVVDMGIAVTGIAGPEGGTKEKPVGTVYVAISCKKEMLAKGFLFKGKRIEIKVQAAENALLMLKNYLMEKYKG